MVTRSLTNFSLSSSPSRSTLALNSKVVLLGLVEQLGELLAMCPPIWDHSHAERSPPRLGLYSCCDGRVTRCDVPAVTAHRSLSLGGCPRPGRGGYVVVIRHFAARGLRPQPAPIPSTLKNKTHQLNSNNSCRFAYSVSYDDPLTCSDASCLTRCHRASVSYSCHFFRKHG